MLMTVFFATGSGVLIASITREFFKNDWNGLLFIIGAAIVLNLFYHKKGDTL